MYALLILDMQVGLVHGPDKPREVRALINTLNELMRSARATGAPIFLARHIGPAGSPIEPGSPLTELVQELQLIGNEVIFEKKSPTPSLRLTWQLCYVSASVTASSLQA